MSKKYARPAMIGQNYRDPLLTDLRNIFFHLGAVCIHPWRLLPHDDGLYFQLRNPNTKIYESKALLTKDGEWKTTGAHTPSTVLDDVGRS